MAKFKVFVNDSFVGTAEGYCANAGNSIVLGANQTCAGASFPAAPLSNKPEVRLFTQQAEKLTTVFVVGKGEFGENASNIGIFTVFENALKEAEHWANGLECERKNIVVIENWKTRRLLAVWQNECDFVHVIQYKLADLEF